MSGLGSFLAGTVTVAYLVGALFFVRFWRRSSERLFLMFAIAFSLLALNQFLAFALDVISEPYSFVYGIRVLAFLLIIIAIVEKNLAARR